jgi:hypothetical protein
MKANVGMVGPVAALAIGIIIETPIGIDNTSAIKIAIALPFNICKFFFSP